MDLSVTESGAGEALVVFVHGVLDRGRSFSRVASILSPQCRVAWYDRRGYGDSADAPHVPADIHGHIEDLVTVLEGRRAVVVGHSFGGVIAAGAAVRAPELVEALVIYESAMAWVPGWDDQTMRQILSGEDPENAGLRLMLGGRYDAMSPAERARLLPQARAFIEEERSTRAATAPYDLASLRVPVVYGFSDIFPVAAVREHLRAVVRDVEFVTVPGGSHNAHRAAPEAFADLTRRGLRRRQ
jgi:pimeloyl-ACP methyl ester carboxylesterase